MQRMLLLVIVLLLITITNCNVVPSPLPLYNHNTHNIINRININTNNIKGHITNIIKSYKTNIDSIFNIRKTSDSNNKFIDNIDDDNIDAIKLLNAIISSKDGWEYVNMKDDVTVEKRFLPAGKFVDSKDAAKGSKHACIKSSGILKANAEDVYNLFLDNSRVSEYNEHCEVVKDIEYYPKKNTKIVWASSPKYGPFKARDFCSIVHYIKSPGGKYIILNRPAYHPSYPPSSKFVRATILLAANIIEPCGKNCSKLTQIAHVNPGGGADNSAIAWIINQLCAVGPPTFIRKLEKASMKKK